MSSSEEKITSPKTRKLEVEKTDLDGVLLIKPLSTFHDFRGSYVELYNKKAYQEAGVHCEFVEDDISVSSKHVLRGIHGNATTWKLVSCLLGKFYLVVVNWDRESPQFGKWVSFTLSDENRHQVLVPAKFGNGHLVLSEMAIFHYKQSAYYERDSQFTLAWNDPRLGIEWPMNQPTVSERDRGVS